MKSAVLAVLRDDPHTSVSALNTYLKCPQQYYLRYIARAPVEHRPASLVFGSTMHGVLAHYYEALMTRAEPTVGELTEVFKAHWAQEIDRQPPVVPSERESLADLPQLASLMLAVFHAQVPRLRDVLAVEEPFSVGVPEPSGHAETISERLVGVLDAVVRDANGNTVVLEHKTAARRYAASKLMHNLQLTAYHYAAPLMGFGSTTLAVQVLTKAAKPAFEIHPVRPTECDVEDLRCTVAGVTSAIRANAFYPVRDWFCSGCPFAGRCLAG